MSKLDRYRQQLDKSKVQLKRYEDKEKILAYQIQQEKRKNRTHRLCKRAGILESFLTEPLTLTDDDVYELMQFLFSLPGVRKKEAELLRARCEENSLEEEENSVLP